MPPKDPTIVPAPKSTRRTGTALYLAQLADIRRDYKRAAVEAGIEDRDEECEAYRDVLATIDALTSKIDRVRIDGTGKVAAPVEVRA